MECWSEWVVPKERVVSVRCGVGWGQVGFGWGQAGVGVGSGGEVGGVTRVGVGSGRDWGGGMQGLGWTAVRKGRIRRSRLGLGRISAR